MALQWADLGGSIYANPKLSEEAEFQSTRNMRLKELTVPGGNMALGKKNGDTVGLKLWGRLAGVSTSPLSENVKVPMGTPPEYTVTGTVFQRGYGVPYTALREMLDRLTIEDVVVHSLNEHSARTHNALINNELVAGRSFCYVPLTSTTGNFTTNGTPTGTAGANMGLFHFRDIRRNLRKNAVPAADGENYIGCFSPTLTHGIFGDATAVTGFVDVAKYTSEADGLLNGEIGKLMNIRILEDNDVLPDNIGTGAAFGSGFIVGLDAVREIVASPMQLIANTNLGGDFGRQGAIAWLSVLGYKAPWNFTAHGDGRIVHVTSA